MAWIESHQELRDHPKRKRLSRLLEISRRETIGLLHELWWWAYDYAPEGDLSAFTDEDLADAIDWDGDAAQLLCALIQAGFIDEGRHIHDWEDFAQKWIERRAADKERKRAKRGPMNGVLKMSGGCPADVSPPSGVTGPDLTIPDLTGPDASPPTPPPQAEEGDAAGAAGKKRRVGRRNGVAHDEPEPVAEVERAPVTSEDGRVWNRALGAASAGLSAGNAEQLGLLVPIGRAPDGGLHLRAPPGQAKWFGRFRGPIARALLDAGDAAGPRVAIVEGRPGESKG